MGKKYKNLMNQICSMPNLYRAYEKASQGKRYSAGHLQFKQHLAANLALLSAALRDGRYRPSKSNVFMVHEPKLREISALPFSDRVVQHALCNVIEPIFERTFLPGSYACRRNKGTHVAVTDAQAIMRRGYTWCLKMDFSKYFASIDLGILGREIQRKISCSGTLSLIGVFLKKAGTGLPIGNLTSQLFANIYGHIQDRFLTHTLGIKSWLRYMDDTIIFAYSREALSVLQHGLKWFIEQSMRLRFSHWSIIPVASGVSFLGYRIWPKYKLLLRPSVVRAKRKINRYRKQGMPEQLDRFIGSWRGHAKWANSHNLLIKLGVA